MLHLYVFNPLNRSLSFLFYNIPYIRFCTIKSCVYITSYDSQYEANLLTCTWMGIDLHGILRQESQVGREGRWR